jgi:hypothetical protein
MTQWRRGRGGNGAGGAGDIRTGEGGRRAEVAGGRRIGNRSAGRGSPGVRRRRQRRRVSKVVLNLFSRPYREGSTFWLKAFASICWPRNLGVESKLILAKLREEGLGDQAPNHMSTLPIGLAESVREWFSGQGGGGGGRRWKPPRPSRPRRRLGRQRRTRPTRRPKSLPGRTSPRPSNTRRPPRLRRPLSLRRNPPLPSAPLRTGPSSSGPLLNDPSSSAPFQRRRRSPTARAGSRCYSAPAPAAPVAAGSVHEPLVARETPPAPPAARSRRR